VKAADWAEYYRAMKMNPGNNRAGGNRSHPGHNLFSSGLISRSHAKPAGPRACSLIAESHSGPVELYEWTSSGGNYFTQSFCELHVPPKWNPVGTRPLPGDYRRSRVKAKKRSRKG
jgi:hypothetical protein